MEEVKLLTKVALTGLVMIIIILLFSFIMDKIDIPKKETPPEIQACFDEGGVWHVADGVCLK
jgi:hypothetical protein